VAVEEARWPAKLQAKPKQEALGPFRRCLGLPSLRKAKKGCEADRTTVTYLGTMLRECRCLIYRLFTDTCLDATIGNPTRQPFVSLESRLFFTFLTL
jgi:hypothetical protein